MRLILAALAVVTMGIVGSGVTSIAKADPPSVASMQFGSESVGSKNKDFRHPTNHASDAIRPRTVVISQGGTVTFHIPRRTDPDRPGLHQVAVFPPGTKPRDVDSVPRTAYSGCPRGDRYIADPEGTPVAPPPCTGGMAAPSYTFSEPGRYLVICTFDSHFLNWDMYGWVIVK
jgi:plastocyanin